MKYYQELTILPDPEISMYFIWRKLYTQLHIALAELHNQHGIGTVGVSFPDYKYEEKDNKEFATLGNKLRIFATSKNDLQILNIQKWLERLSDYIHIKSVQEVPPKHGWLVASRYRYKSLENQAKQFAKHRGISLEESLQHCKQYKKAGRKGYPFINLKSLDNGQNFKLAIKQVEVESVGSGEFNTYGLNTNSQQATVPHWK
ncbi:MAG: type I-F CRISPR-associated endoribonuclease Cas6/Csy4 [Gammaproteobacteria bacterium]|nr:MAG: type I-F CRISPR-associated endoribonuclease Cas6/Csy4 [Gammaproteobacteria bacterium]